MSTVTGFTAERMLAIENGTVVDGSVVGDNLILTTKDGTPIDAGNVRGAHANEDVLPTGGTVPLRDAEGNVKTAPPVDTNDAATKLYVDTRLPMSTTNAPLGPISNFNTSGQFILQTLPTGKRKVILSNVRLVRVSTNFGAISTTAWTLLGTLIPSACLIGQSMYLSTFTSVSGGAGAMPIIVFLDFTPGVGTISIRGMTGLTTTINVNDAININTTLVET